MAGQESDGKKTIQLEDIARQLGLSKSTVSRAISGKGNIGEATRRRVREYIAGCGYHPNASAQRLATGKTGNIGVAIPSDAFLNVNTFFQVCLMGICREAVKKNYDIVVTSVTETDITYLKKLLARRAVDGVILMRSLVDDTPKDYLSGRNFPFVTIGSVDGNDAVQVDVEHREACRSLVSELIRHSTAPVGMVVGGLNYIVNRNRYRGFTDAQELLPVDERLAAMTDITDKEGCDAAVNQLLKDGAGTIVCGDDNLCLMTLNRLEDLKISVPQQVRVASLYDSPVLKNRGITAVEADDMLLGMTAVRKLIEVIEGRLGTGSRHTIGYSINYRGSTGGVQ